MDMVECPRLQGPEQARLPILRVRLHSAIKDHLEVRMSNLFHHPEGFIHGIDEVGAGRVRGSMQYVTFLFLAVSRQASKVSRAHSHASMKVHFS